MQRLSFFVPFEVSSSRLCQVLYKGKGGGREKKSQLKWKKYYQSRVDVLVCV